MAGGARALLAIIIMVIVAAAVALPALRLLPPPWLWFARRRGFLALYAVAVNKRGDAQYLTNASFSVWVFYPTKNGTVFQAIYNGTGGLAYINLSSLIKWAEAWIDYYGPQAIYSFMPSLIVFVSYPIKVNSTTVEVVSQQFMVPLNLSEPLSKEGEVIELEVNHPFRFYYRVAGAAGREYGGALGTTIRPAQTTTTTTTSTSITPTTAPILSSEGLYLIIYKPHVLAWYPSNDSVAPISLEVGLAQPTPFNYTSGYMNADLYLATSVINEEGINAVAIAGSVLPIVVDDVEAGAVAQGIARLSAMIPGATLTFTQVSQVYSHGYFSVDISNHLHYDVGQIYMVGQAALVNWTLCSWTLGTPPSDCSPVGWQVGTMLTAVQVVESGSALAPALYHWMAFDPCVNLTAWADEYPKVEFGYGNPGLPQQVYAAVVNETCPMPNTPAPVDWQDYAYYITYETEVPPGNSTSFPYVKLEEATGPSPLGVVIDTGSALATTAGLLTVAAGMGVPVADMAFVVAAVLDSVQFSSNAVAAVVNSVDIYSSTVNTTFVYFSNMTPRYFLESNGINLTLPRDLVFITNESPQLVPILPPGPLPMAGQPRSP